MPQKHKFVIVNITDKNNHIEVEHLGMFDTKHQAYLAIVEYMKTNDSKAQYKIKSKRIV